MASTGNNKGSAANGTKNGKKRTADGSAKKAGSPTKKTVEETVKRTPEEKLEIFKKWLHANGTIVNPDVEVRIKHVEYKSKVAQRNGKSAVVGGKRVTLPEYEFGVYAKEAIDDDVVLCNMSRNTILSCKNCGIADLLAISGLDGSFGLSIALMYELALGVKSAWYGYLQSLPEVVDIPLFWSREQINLLGLVDESLCMKVFNDKKTISDEYRTVVRDFLEMNEDVFKYQDLDIHGPKFSLDSFKHATALATSRAYEVDYFHGISMVPFIDLFNHSSDEHAHFECEASVCPECGEFYCDCAEDDGAISGEDESVIDGDEFGTPHAGSDDEEMEDLIDEGSQEDDSSEETPRKKRLRLQDIVDGEDSETIQTDVVESPFDSDNDVEKDSVVFFNEDAKKGADKFKSIVEKLLGRELPAGAEEEVVDNDEVEQLIVDDKIKGDNDVFVPNWDTEEAPELFNIGEFMSESESDEDDDEEEVKGDAKTNKAKYFPTIDEDPIADCDDESLLQMRTIRSIEKGGEIFGKYGDFNDSDLLNKFGFVEGEKNEFNKIDLRFKDILENLLFCDVPVNSSKNAPTTMSKSLKKLMNSWSPEKRTIMGDIIDALNNTHKFDLATVTERAEWWESIGSRIAQDVITEITGPEEGEGNEDSMDEDDLYMDDGGDDEDDDDFTEGELVDSDDDAEEDEEEEKPMKSKKSKKDESVESLMDELESGLAGLDGEASEGSEDMEEDDFEDIDEDDEDDFEDEDSDEDEDEDEGEVDENGNKIAKYGETSFYVNSQGQTTISLLMFMSILVMKPTLFARFKKLVTSALLEGGVIDADSTTGHAHQLSFMLNMDPDTVTACLNSPHTELIRKYFLQIAYLHCAADNLSAGSWVVVNRTMGPQVFGLYSCVDENEFVPPEEEATLGFFDAGVMMGQHSTTSPTTLKIKSILTAILRAKMAAVKLDAIEEIQVIGVSDSSTVFDEQRVAQILALGNTRCSIMRKACELYMSF